MQIAYLIALKDKDNPITISVVDETMPKLKRGAMKDFYDFLQSEKLYQPGNHNKTDNYYKIGKAKVEFFSCDTPDKVHGPSRDYLFAIEIQYWNYDTFFHLLQRTSQRVYADFNPTHEFWAYTEFIDNPQYREDLTFIHSTIFDNQFAPEALKKDILLRADRDPNYKRVYLEGKVGKLEGLVFPNFETINYLEFPECKIKCFGMDVGFNDPTVILELRIDTGKNKLYIHQLCYAPEMETKDIIKVLEDNNIKKRIDEIYSDIDLRLISEVFNKGYNVKPVGGNEKKIEAGLKLMKDYDIIISKESIAPGPYEVLIRQHKEKYEHSTIKDFRNFRFAQDKNGAYLDSPVNLFKHAPDAARYGFMMKTIRPVPGNYSAVSHVPMGRRFGIE